MSPTVPKDRRVDGPTNFGEEICHIVTEDNPDTALCGKDVTGWPWNPPWPYCVVCLDLHQMPLRWRSTSSDAIASRRRARCTVASGAMRKSRRRDCHERSR